MDINIALDNVINYIEENICGDINYETAAQMLGTSVFHFQRMFSFLTGLPIAEYIRRRKMTLAAFDIQKSDEKIIDIAVKYGYESHSSFTRAFQLFHGTTPTAVRNEGASVKVCPPLRISVTVKGIDSINFRIEKNDPYKLFGKQDIIVPMEHKYARDFIIDYGYKVVENGIHSSINIAAGFAADDSHPFHLLHGVYFKDEYGATRFIYGWELPEGGVDESFTIINVPKATWAVFTYYGEHMESLPKIWTYIYTNWLYTSGYKIDDHIVVEKETYLDEKQESFCAEVWMPIKEI